MFLHSVKWDFPLLLSINVIEIIELYVPNLVIIVNYGIPNSKFKLHAHMCVAVMLSHIWCSKTLKCV